MKFMKILKIMIKHTYYKKTNENCIKKIVFLVFDGIRKN
jgi:hypothetical protein